MQVFIVWQVNGNNRIIHSIYTEEWRAARAADAFRELYIDDIVFQVRAVDVKTSAQADLDYESLRWSLKQPWPIVK